MTQPSDYSDHPPIELIRLIRACVTEMHGCVDSARVTSVEGLTLEEARAVQSVQAFEARLDRLSGRPATNYQVQGLYKKRTAALLDASKAFGRRDPGKETMPDWHESSLQEPADELKTAVLGRRKLMTATVKQFDAYARHAFTALEEINRRADVSIASMSEDDSTEREEHFAQFRKQFNGALNGRSLWSMRSFIRDTQLTLRDSLQWLGLDVLGRDLGLHRSVASQVEADANFLLGKGILLCVAVRTGLVSPTDPVRLLVVRGVDQSKSDSVVIGDIAVGWGSEATLTGEQVEMPCEDWSDLESIYPSGSKNRNSPVLSSYRATGVMIDNNIISVPQMTDMRVAFASPIHAEGSPDALSSLSDRWEDSRGAAESFQLAASCQLNDIKRSMRASGQDLLGPDRAQQMLETHGDLIIQSSKDLDLGVGF